MCGSKHAFQTLCPIKSCNHTVCYTVWADIRVRRSQKSWTAWDRRAAQ